MAITSAKEAFEIVVKKNTKELNDILGTIEKAAHKGKVRIETSINCVTVQCLRDMGFNVTKVYCTLRSEYVILWCESIKKEGAAND